MRSSIDLPVWWVEDDMSWHRVLVAAPTRGLARWCPDVRRLFPDSSVLLLHVYALGSRGGRIGRRGDKQAVVRRRSRLAGMLTDDEYGRLGWRLCRICGDMWCGGDDDDVCSECRSV